MIIGKSYFSHELKWIHNSKAEVEFKESCFKQEKATFSHRTAVNLFIAFELDTWSENWNTDFTLGGCLFGALKLTMNSDTDKYEYIGYGIGFDSHSDFSANGEFGKNAIIFYVDTRFSKHDENKTKILVLFEGPT